MSCLCFVFSLRIWTRDRVSIHGINNLEERLYYFHIKDLVNIISGSYSHLNNSYLMQLFHNGLPTAAGQLFSSQKT